MKSRPRVVRTLRGLRRHERADRDTLEAFRDAALRRVVSHAYERVPHYRALFDAHGVRPEHVRGAEDLARVPLTTRRDLIETPVEKLVAEGHDPARLIVRKTSGSSGQPLTIRRTWLEQNLLHTFRLRALRSLGCGPRDRMALIGSLRRDDPRDNKLLGRLLHGVGLQYRFKVGALRPPDEVLDALARLRPDVVSGHAGVLHRLAGLLIDRPRDEIRPRVVLSGSEVLTPVMRTRIEQAFGAPVRDTYGTHELNLVAWECPSTGRYHTCDDALVIEVLRDGKPAAPGERGEVVVTGLHSYAMPFVRYKLGDIVTRDGGPCACGRPFGTIGAIQGRMLDFFPLPDGRLFHPYEIVTGVFPDYPWIGQYELVQEREDRIVMHVVPYGDLVGPEVTRLCRAVEAVLGAGVEFEVEPVRELAPEPNGKFRVSRSRVRSDYDGIDWERVSPGREQLPEV